MDERDLQFFARAAGGTPLPAGSGAVVRRVCTDSRQLRAGDLFVAIAGDRFDGHAFLAEAARAGAVGAVVSKDGPVEAGLPVIRVSDTRLALGRMAAGYRRDFTPPLVAVAGSNGKTTTKELIGSMLRQLGPALVSEASFNNDIGVPLTLLQLEGRHRAGVLEAGTNHPGELRPLLEMIQPSLGVITSIGREHLEFFGDLDGVVQEEGTLADLLPPDGTLFVNGDCPFTPGLIRRTRARVVRVGFGSQNDWCATLVGMDPAGSRFAVRGPRGVFDGEYEISLPGRHQVINSLLAMAVGTELGLTGDQARRALAECTPPKLRLQLWERDGVRVLDDSYNANADSMAAALRTLAELPCGGRRVAVLGEMGELGAHAATAHEETGRLAAELGVQRLITVGALARITARAARDAGLALVTELADVEEAVATLREELTPGDVVLIKASRAARLERISTALREDRGAGLRTLAAPGGTRRQQRALAEAA